MKNPFIGWMGLSLVLVAALALPEAAHADPASTRAIDWAAVTADDLNAIHDLLRDNSPATVVDRDSAHFRLWLEEGRRKCLQRVHDVHDANGYGYLLSYYANGFHDSHIGFRRSPTSKSHTGWSAPDAWPGFMLGLRSQGYTVVYTSPKASDIPPVGAILVSCDGHLPNAMVAERDGYDGDLSLESGRIEAARDLLLDRGNPFVPRPVQCVFRSAGVDRSYTLHWQRMDLDQWPAAAAASLGSTTGALGIQGWGDRRWWITVPSMSGNLDWNSFYHSVEENLAAIRNADRVVIDLRGNGGGDSSFGERLVTMLWGQEFVDRYRPDLGPTIWRASKLNRDYWATATKQASEPSYSAEEKAVMNSILAEYDKAIAEGKPTFEMPGAARPKFSTASEANPMHGRVMVLTNYACNSACLDTMDLLMALPGVAQAGTTTSADTIFMELTVVDPLPSGLGRFVFGHKAWIERPRGSNKPYTPAPSLTWHGEPNDENGFKAWLMALVPQAKAEDATTAVLALSWQEFDQTPHSGWRAIGEDAKRYQEAASLIEAYLARHAELDQSRKAILHWHALQVFAMAGDTTAALKHISLTRLDPEPPDSPVLWNDYVDATEAFLRHDRPKLLAARKRIASNNPDDANLHIVDAFISHFDEPYAKAYGATK